MKKEKKEVCPECRGKRVRNYGCASIANSFLCFCGGKGFNEPCRRCDGKGEIKK
jgi:hypothetical protein